MEGSVEVNLSYLKQILLFNESSSGQRTLITKVTRFTLSNPWPIPHHFDIKNSRIIAATTSHENDSQISCTYLDKLGQVVLSLDKPILKLAWDELAGNVYFLYPNGIGVTKVNNENKWIEILGNVQLVLYSLVLLLLNYLLLKSVVLQI